MIAIKWVMWLFVISTLLLSRAALGTEQTSNKAATSGSSSEQVEPQDPSAAPALADATPSYERHYEDRLWLPVSYQTHYNEMLTAAKMVTGDSDCYELIRGALSERDSSPDHPVFRFHCRTDKRQMFSILVDGVDFSMTHSIKAMLKREAQAKKKKRDDDIRKKRLEQEKYWKICEREFTEKTRLFDDVIIHTKFPPRSKISPNGMVKYRIHFQAQSLTRRTVSYRALANIDSLKACEVIIKPI